MIISAFPVLTRAQSSNETPGFTVAPNGELLIKPSATSSANDFDFFVGSWEISNHKLNGRLVHSKSWTDFTAKCSVNKILNGIGNTDHFYATFDGKPFEGLTLRLFDPKTKLWSIYWAASDKGKLEPPVLGSFKGNIGTFYGRDTWNRKSVIVQYRWNKTNPKDLLWSQAYSTDNGKTWEWNWYMHEKPINTKGKKS